jgi:hypothetical protein
MDDAAERFIDELKARLRSRSQVAFPHTHLVIAMVAGDLTQARRMAEAANLAVYYNPEILLLLSIDGVDGDVREIDQIPASRGTLCALLKHLNDEAFHRFEIETQAIMLVAAGHGRRDGTSLEIWPPYVKRLRAPR